MGNNAPKTSKVAVIRCDSYDPDKVRSAVREAIELLGGLDSIFGEEPAFAVRGKEAEVVLKVNLLGKAEPAYLVGLPVCFVGGARGVVGCDGGWTAV